MKWSPHEVDHVPLKILFLNILGDFVQEVPPQHIILQNSGMTMLPPSRVHETQPFRVTQSLIVLGVVVGGIFLILIVANISLGIFLWVQESKRSKKQRHDKVKTISNREQSAAKRVQSIPGTLRLIYRPQTRTQSGSFNDGNVAFEGPIRDGMSESIGSSESEDAVGEGWHVPHDPTSSILSRHHIQLSQQKWQKVLNGRRVDISEKQTNQGHVNNQNQQISTPCLDTGDNTIQNDIIISSRSSSNPERTCHFEQEFKGKAGRIQVKEQKKCNTQNATEGKIRTQDNILTSTDLNITQQNLQNEQPSLHDGMIINSPIRFKSKKTKPSRPGKLYKKRHEIVRTDLAVCEHYGSRGFRQSLGSPPPSPVSSFSPFSTQEIISEEREETDGMEDPEKQDDLGELHSQDARTDVNLSFRDQNEKNTFSDVGTSRIAIEVSNGGKGINECNPGGIQRCHGIVRERDEVTETSCDTINERFSTEASGSRIQTFPRDQTASISEEIKDDATSLISPSIPDHYIIDLHSPILEWSISDDAKQSYFNQAMTVPNNEAIFSSTSHEVDAENRNDGNTMFQSSPLGQKNIQSVSTDDRVNISKHNIIIENKNAYSTCTDLGHDKLVKKKAARGDNDSNMRLLKMPVRKRSFVHRLFDRSKRPKNAGILKTFHSEDVLHSHASSKLSNFQRRTEQSKASVMESPRAMDLDGYQHKLFEKDSGTQTGSEGRIHENEKTELHYQSHPDLPHGQVSHKYPLAYVMPRFTLSEEDLRMYPDDSIPTLEELVKNSTVRRKKAAKKRIKQNRGNPSRSKENENFVLNIPKHRLPTAIKHYAEYNNTARTQSDATQINQSETESTTVAMFKCRSGEMDTDVLGFHTGVSDRYHSITDQRASGFGQINFHRQVGLRGPMFIPEPLSNKNGKRNTSHGDDTNHVNDEWIPSEVSDLDDGNWNINIASPGSHSSKELDSVSSFALSDFDMGESDVDEVSKAGDFEEDVALKDDLCHSGKRDITEDVRAIQDVRL